MNPISGRTARWTTAGVVCIALATVAAGAVPSSSQQAATSATPAASVADGQARRASVATDMKLFRTAGRAAPAATVDRINAALGTALSLRNDHAEAANVREAVRNGRFAAQIGMGDRGVCLAISDAGGSGSMQCRPLVAAGNSEADKPPMFAVDSTENGFRLTAMVTDDVTGGEVTDAKGRTQSGTVTNNVFYVETTTEPKELVLLSTSHGKWTFPLTG
jgi:hypothetical protein